jgi:Domain of unknown function (DUF4272)
VEQSPGFKSSTLRKTQSEAILSEWEVAIHPNLPEIETADEVEPRDPIEIARRAVCLMIVSARSELEGDEIDGLIEDFGVGEFFTPHERAYLAASNPSDRDQIQFSWRVEAAWVLLWSLGFVSDLGLPLEQISPGDAIDILEKQGVQGLAENPHRPSMEEVLDQADLIYRAHWAIRRFGKDGTPLDVDVTPERHHALNWLIRYDEDAAWDDITTDT